MWVPAPVAWMWLPALGMRNLLRRLRTWPAEGLRPLTQARPALRGVARTADLRLRCRPAAGLLSLRLLALTGMADLLLRLRTACGLPVLRRLRRVGRMARPTTRLVPLLTLTGMVDLLLRLSSRAATGHLRTLLPLSSRPACRWLSGLRLSLRAWLLTPLPLRLLALRGHGLALRIGPALGGGRMRRLSPPRLPALACRRLPPRRRLRRRLRCLRIRLPARRERPAWTVPTRRGSGEGLLRLGTRTRLRGRLPLSARGLPLSCLRSLSRTCGAGAR